MTSDQKSQLNLPVYEQAAEWLIEVREGEVDDRTRERLDTWFRESPLHIRAYLELSAVWEDGTDPDLDRAHTTEELIALARSSDNVVSLKPAAAGSTARASEPSETESEARSPTEELPIGAGSLKARLSARTRRFPWRSAWAATIVIACAAGGASYYLYNQRDLYLTSGIGEERFVKLADGSTVELNSRTRVRVRFAAHQRDVDLLEGQALFHVAKDASRPFIVHADSMMVRAVGTQFDVYRKATGTVVTVVEGRVAVLSPLLKPATPDQGDPSQVRTPQTPSAGGATHFSTSRENRDRAGALGHGLEAADFRNAIFLSAGEQVTVTPRADALPVQADTAVATAWTQHELVFDSTPLADVAQEFNRYNTRQLIISDPALQGFHITGVFSSADPASLLKFLRAQPDIRVLETDQEIQVLSK